MSKMAEQRAMRFTKQLSLRLAIGVVRFRRIDCNDAVVMACQNPPLIPVDRGIVAEKLEFEPVDAVLALADQRQWQRKNGVQQSAFGGLELRPRLLASAQRQAGNGGGQAARFALRIGIPARYRPIAQLMFSVVGAQLECLSLERRTHRRSPQPILALAQGEQLVLLGNKGQLGAALKAPAVLEKN
jgi:hypothetical protein